MITFPKAKINLGLRIISKRSDGYHDIETIFYPVGLSDALEYVVPGPSAKDDELVVTGLNIGTKPEKNLVVQAVRKLRERFPVPFLKIHLHKAIPSGAGLGGGSSDAASMLRMLVRCYSLEINETELRNFALELGSDCPFFIDPEPSLAAGRGEILKSVKPFLKGYHIVLLNPGINISTGDAFLNCKPALPKINLETLLLKDFGEWKKTIKNDFEDYAFTLYPQIGELKKSLYNSGALYSSMSGSGSTVYGIFREKPEVDAGMKGFVIYEGTL
jgi:4-diphosphocytidyl-2-C-methyl-D-erythritol kinase